MYKALRPFLNKGGAGYYASRSETAERLLPLVERHVRLLRAYERVLPQLTDAAGAERLRGLLPYARTEFAKLNETLNSAGGRGPTGSGIEADLPAYGGSDYD